MSPGHGTDAPGRDERADDRALDEARARHLRLLADFDNYRRPAQVVLSVVAETADRWR